MMEVLVLFGAGLLLVLFKWAMDEAFIYRRARRQSRPPMRGPVMPFDEAFIYRRARRQSRPPMRGPVMPPFGDFDNDEGGEL